MDTDVCQIEEHLASFKQNIHNNHADLFAM